MSEKDQPCCVSRIRSFEFRFERVPRFIPPKGGTTYLLYTGARVSWGEHFPNLDRTLAVKYSWLFFEVFLKRRAMGSAGGPVLPPLRQSFSLPAGAVSVGTCERLRDGATLRA